MMLTSPAKLTLFLEVLGAATDGYHPIDAQMVSLDLVDLITLEETTDDTQINIQAIYEDKDWAEAIPSGKTNLVRRALDMVDKKAKVNIQKAIPPGSGLGGGSSNAAAILSWADMFDTSKAVSIGADVAFCLKGGRAQVSGMGENIQMLEFIEETYTLLIPPISCSTPEVYLAWDELGCPKGKAGNDLEPAALAVVPELAFWRDYLAEISGQRPRLAGSGSTWFVEGTIENEAIAKGAINEDIAKVDAKLVIAKTTPARK